MKDHTDSESLFDSPSAPPGGSVIYLTNRYNFLEILSAGYIAPKASYNKYYDDLLQLCPGHIPLLSGPIPVGAQRLVSASSESSFPVALEIDPQMLSRSPVPAVRVDGTPGEAIVGTSGFAAWAIPGVIPISAIQRGLFRNKMQLVEHTSREYENVPQKLSIEVREELFEEGGSDIAFLVKWLKSLTDSQKPNRDQFANIDRLSGARCLAVASLPTTSSVAATIARFLMPLDKAPRKTKGIKTTDSQGGAAWITPEGALGLGVSPSTTDLETRLFWAAAEVFRQLDRSAGWRPIEALDRIDALLRLRKLSKKDDAAVGRHFDLIRAILRNERDFKPFKKSVGLDVAKALLLVLQRPQAERLLAWSVQETGADAPVVLTAVILAGLLTGRSRLSTRLRPTSLDNYLSNEACFELGWNPEKAINQPKLGIPSLVKTTNDKGKSMAQLLVDSVVLKEWPAQGPTLSDKLLKLAFNTSAEKESAIKVCRLMQWADCVKSHVVIETTRITIDRTPKGNSLRLTVEGWPEFVPELVEDRFRDRLTVDGVAPEYAAQVEGILKLSSIGEVLSKD